VNETARPVAIVGKLDGIGPDGVVRGWCWSPQEPQAHRTVLLVSGGMTLATAVCDRPREDLSQLGMGNGNFGFEARIDRGLFGPAPGRVLVALQDAQTGRTIGRPADFSYPAQAVRERGAIRAYLDRVDDEGLLNGWAWCRSEPERRVRLRFLVNGDPVGSVVANMFRGDLQAAGAGDGCYAFSFLLPWEAISRTSACHVTVVDDATGEQLNASTVFRRPALRPVEDRLRDVERNVRLLAARMGELEQRGRQEAASSRALLGVIGAFFTRLSEMNPEEVPTALVPSLSGLLDGTAARLRPFALGTPDASAATLCFEASGTLEGLHAALSAVRQAGIDAAAVVAVLDDGSMAEAALLPSLVQNLRYTRLQPGQSVVEARNRLARAGSGTVVAFLSPAVRLEEGWLAAILAAFERHPECGVIGSRTVREDGTVHAFGLLPDRDGGLSDPAAAEDAHHPRFDHVRPVAAVSDWAIVIRASVFDVLGGFDESFADPGAAAMEFCLRCWQAGHTVLALPSPALRWSAEGDARPDPDLMDMLAQRWLDWAPPGWPGAVGRALLVGRPGDGAGLRSAAAALQRNGWQVSAIAPGWSGEDEAGHILRLDGVEVLHSPFQPSVAAALADPAAGFGLVQVTGNSAAAVPPERVRELAPQAKIVLSLDEVDLPLAPELLAAVAASDLAVVSTPALLRALRDTGGALAGLPLFPAGPSSGGERFGLCLWAADGVDDVDAAWFVASVWPLIRRRQLGLRLILPDGTERRRSRRVVIAPTSLAHAWAAVSPRRTGALDPLALAWCRQAGVPLIAMRVTLPSGAEPGVVPVEDTPAAIVQAITRLAREPQLWADTADIEPARVTATPDELAARYAEVLDYLHLPHRSVAIGG
jgi:hypothetical protein